MNQKRGWPAFRFSLKGILLGVVCASLLLSLLQEKENAATLRQEMARTETATYNFQLREKIITVAQQNLTIEKLLESVGEPPFLVSRTPLESLDLDTTNLRSCLLYTSPSPRD